MSAVLPLVLPLTASVVQGAVLNGLSNPGGGVRPPFGSLFLTETIDVEPFYLTELIDGVVFYLTEVA